MRKLKTLTAILMLALVMSLSTAQAMAGEILTPPIAGDIGAPGLNGDMGSPGLAGDMATGIYAAIISFFG